MALSDILSQEEMLRKNEATMNPQPQIAGQVTPAMQSGGMQNPAEARLFMDYAQKFAAAGLNTHADNFLAISKALGGGAEKNDAALYAKYIDMPNNSTGKTHRYLYDPKTQNYSRDIGPLGSEEYKIGSRQQVVLQDGKGTVVDSFFNPVSKKVEYYDHTTQTLKPITVPYIPAGMMLNTTETANLGVPYGTTKGEAAAKGVSSVSPQKRGELAAFEQSMNIVSDMEKYSKKVNTFNAGPAGMERIYNAAKNTIGSQLQTNPDATMLDTKGGELSNIIRAMGEKGTLAEGDVQRGLMLIPTKGDTKQVAEQKIKDLRDLFGKNKAALSGSLTSPVGGNKKPDPFGIR